MNVVSGGEVGEKVVEELGDGRLAVKVVGPGSRMKAREARGAVEVRFSTIILRRRVATG